MGANTTAHYSSRERPPTNADSSGASSDDNSNSSNPVSEYFTASDVWPFNTVESSPESYYSFGAISRPSSTIGDSDPYGTLSFIDNIAVGAGLDPPSSPLNLTTLHFIHDQLVPVSYLRQMEYINPKKFSTYPRVQSFVTFEDIMFYIEGEHGTRLPEPNFFVITVYGPTSGSYTPVNIKSGPRGHTWRIRPSEAGTYVLTVRLGSRGHHHIQGSPAILTVSRNYPKSVNGSIVMFKTIGTQLGKRIYKPWGIAVDRRSNKIYMADKNGNQILIYSIDGQLLKTFGKPGQHAGEFYHPTAIAVDEINSRIIVADKDNHRICILDLDGNFKMDFGREGDTDNQLSFPWGVAVSKNGKLIAVAEARNHRIQLFDQDGVFLQSLTYRRNTHSRMNKYSNPRGICFDNESKLVYVSDVNLKAVYVFNIAVGIPELLVASNYLLEQPQGISVDDAGNILICDSAKNCIFLFSRDGVLSYTINRIGGSQNMDNFKSPVSLAITSGGYLAILDNAGCVRIC